MLGFSSLDTGEELGKKEGRGNLEAEAGQCYEHRHPQRQEENGVWKGSLGFLRKIEEVILELARVLKNICPSLSARNVFYIYSIKCHSSNTGK